MIRKNYAQNVERWNYDQGVMWRKEDRPVIEGGRYIHKDVFGYRSPGTHYERRKYFDSIDQGVKPRARRNHVNLPNSWDDVPLARGGAYTKSWKRATKSRKQYMKHKQHPNWTEEKFNDQEENHDQGPC